MLLAALLPVGCGEDAPDPRSDRDDAAEEAQPDASDGRVDAAQEHDAGESRDSAAVRDDAGQAAIGAPRLPAAPAQCPTIRDGDVLFGETKVRVWVGDDGMSKLGPLVLYWHGTCSAPLEAQLLGIGSAGIERIKAEGGMVAAIESPYRSPNNFCQAVGLASTPTCPGTRIGNGVWCHEDFEVADAIVACAIQQVGIDPRRIHSAGMSAGGVTTVAYGYARSGYLASLTSYSGGGLAAILSPTIQDPDNKFAAMIVHGGERDVVGAANFPMLSQLYHDELTNKGHFSFLCDHGMGHTIPRGIGETTVQFFADHPFGVSPEPYQDELPDSFPTYCTLP